MPKQDVQRKYMEIVNSCGFFDILTEKLEILRELKGISNPKVREIFEHRLIELKAVEDATINCISSELEKHEIIVVTEDGKLVIRRGCDIK